MVAVVLAALLTLWLLARRTVRRSLRELTALVHWSGRIVESQQAVDPPPTTTHEIAQLEGAFDALVRRLLDALARERANSAHIAHELRTPLTSIAAELDSIHVPGDAAQAAIARVRADVMRLADVIEAILVLSASRSELRRDDAVVNVADIARDLAPASAKIQAPDEALVHGDERLVALALRNLVENAGRYGTGVDCVRVTREGDAVRIAVVDRGPGLDETARTRMFDRYWRGSADGEGKGLGLALVRAVAERHEGSVDARPGADGRGLQVSLTLGGLIGWHEEAAPSG
jgi:signal transduction histidine kinase